MARCNVCDRLNEDHYRFCLGCGNQLAPVPAADMTVSPPERTGEKGLPPDSVADSHSRGATTTPIKLCPKCGMEVPTQFIFCSNCGTKVEVAPPKPQNPLLVSDSGVQREDALHSDERITGGTSEDQQFPLQHEPGTSEVIASLNLIETDGSEKECLTIGMGDTWVGRRWDHPLLSTDPYLSPLHAVFRVEQPRKVQVTDGGSLNGVFLRLTSRWELTDGDIFRIGQELLLFEELAPDGKVVEAQDGSMLLGSPDIGYWGRLSQLIEPARTADSYLLSEPEVILGRERGSIRFPDDGFVSSSHCRLEYKEGRRFIEDLGSSNGTFIRLSKETMLKEDDIILLGRQMFVLRFK